MKCKECGIEIAWGEPTGEAWEMFQRGEINLRGCIVPFPGTPIFCHYCGAYIGGYGNKTPDEGCREFERLWRTNRQMVKDWGFETLDDIKRYFDPETHRPKQLYQHHRKKR